MILTDLLGLEVHAETFVGYVSDVRFLLDEFSTDQPMPTARLYGLVVSPRAKSSSLGFERADVRSPWPIAVLVRWRHRGTFLVHWADVGMISSGRVDLRPGYRRLSSSLLEPAVGEPGR